MPQAAHSAAHLAAPLTFFLSGRSAFISGQVLRLTDLNAPANLNATLEIEGLLRTMFDNRNMLAQQVSAQLVSHFGDKVYKSVIPRNIRLAEAPSYGLPVLIYDKTSRGALAYLELAKEIILKNQQVKDKNHG